MGKTYIDTVKYLIKASFEVDGIVEKPDIVGAIFGQTEGLLGDELDLRELQKNGRIGRIEVESQVRGGKSIGTILIPSSLDMVETSILAASLEIVDRVGPCEARIATNKIEDTRNLKRKTVLDRAKTLLKTMIMDEIPESKELSDMVREDAKISEVGTYGEDKLPCGPEVQGSEAIIMVEGRADVVNLLRNGIKNVVAIGGANVGKTITQLGLQKEVTVFLDGDRGGDIILKELMNATDIDYVARAPPGKEVEELARKEIIMSLRRRVPIEQIDAAYAAKKEERTAAFNASNLAPRPVTVPRQVSRMREESSPFPERKPMETLMEGEQQVQSKVYAAPQTQQTFDPTKISSLRTMLKELEGSLKARILDKNGAMLMEVPIREVMHALGEFTGEAEAIVLDGIVTQRLLDLAEQKKISFVVGIRAGNITHNSATTKVILAE